MKQYVLGKNELSQPPAAGAVGIPERAVAESDIHQAGRDVTELLGIRTDRRGPLAPTAKKSVPGPATKSRSGVRRRSARYVVENKMQNQMV